MPLYCRWLQSTLCVFRNVNRRNLFCLIVQVVRHLSYCVTFRLSFFHHLSALNVAKAAASWSFLVPFDFLCAEHIPYSCVSLGVQGRQTRGAVGRRQFFVARFFLFTIGKSCEAAFFAPCRELIAAAFLLAKFSNNLEASAVNWKGILSLVLLLLLLM